MNDKPKGRPPLEPRIKNVEELCEALAGIIRFNEERIAALEASVATVGAQAIPTPGVPPDLGWQARVAVLERQIAAMNDAFSHGNLPRPQYESQFTVWPGAQSDGTR